MKRRHLLAAAMCIGLAVPNLFAQAAQTPPSSEGWQVRVIPYLWGAGLDGRVAIGEHSVAVDVPFADILDALNVAAMGALEAHRDRFATVTDVMYLNLSDESATPGPLYSTSDAGVKLFILSPAAGWRLAGSESAFIDALGGFRFWRLNGELTLNPGLLDGFAVSASRNWVDGIFALKGRVRISKSWSLSGYGDAGGGGSNLTYQILGAASADLGSRFALVLGYRYLDVAYNRDRVVLDTWMRGPVLGFAIKF